MPIKEEPVRIEFQYEKEDAKSNDEVFNVEYFSEKKDDKEKKYVKLAPQGGDTASVFELDFLVEVVDFLRGKGVVDEKIPDGPIPREGLPLPSIQVSGSPGMPVGTVPRGPMTPSTDIFSPANHIPVSGFAKTGESSILEPPIIHSSKTGGPTVIVAPAEGEAATVIDRPVIRTRIAENEDPMVALEESNRQRQKQKQINPEKSIKRKEAADAV